MGFKTLIYFMLKMIKESTQNALERYFAETDEGQWMSQQAFSEARQKIKWEAFQEMFEFTVNAWYENKEVKRWRGLRLMAIDGSVLQLPNDKKLLAYFGGTGPGNTSPCGRGSLLYDVLNDCVMDARLDPYKIGEHTQADEHIKHLEGLASFGEWKELILFDRGYPSRQLIQDLTEKKIHFLMRVRRSFAKKVDALPLGDHCIDLIYKKNQLKVRVIKFILPGGEEETLLTNLFDSSLSIEDFSVLYFKRWPIETEYNLLKQKLEIENFSGRLVDNIRQDFFIAMTLTNIAADFYGEAQVEVETEQKAKKNKYQYQVNVNHAIGVLKDRLVKAILEEDDKKRDELFNDMIRRFKKRLIPIRPNRSQGRKRYPRKAKFHHNHKSNC
jgi:hypothetical protein